jgi:hypothetical protein
MKDVQIQQHNEILDQYEGALLADGFEDALIGFGHRFNYPVAIYDYNRCIGVLMNRDGMTDEEAIEFFDFNVAGAYVGEHTPVFLVDNV